jgi:hypothetical protein
MLPWPFQGGYSMTISFYGDPDPSLYLHGRRLAVFGMPPVLSRNA